MPLFVAKLNPARKLLLFVRRLSRVEAIDTLRLSLWRASSQYMASVPCVATCSLNQYMRSQSSCLFDLSAAHSVHAFSHRALASAVLAGSDGFHTLYIELGIFSHESA